ncbi:hypothetical protein M0813_29057 [Anaeramoeba flamelloides]|uniref:Uncharacterized protein n=1 Tax=Anaeramoeba flamelloides TaxID=1746091 RepID=A0ABQ8XR40_9EUKA|nr:hypothetical protein M0813_29057 [Anaeramoeba flamelloides]
MRVNKPIKGSVIGMQMQPIRNWVATQCRVLSSVITAVASNELDSYCLVAMRGPTSPLKVLLSECKCS